MPGMSDVTASISERAVLPVALLAAAGFLSSAGARVIDPLLHIIAGDFHTTVPAVSVVIAAFTLPYGLCQLVLGPVADRVGKLRVMLAALVLYAFATAACAMASNLAELTLLRAFAGGASAGLIPSAMAYIGDAVPYDQRQVTLSRFMTGTVMATIVAGPIGGIFGEYIGWRGVFLLLSGAALLLAFTLAFRLPSLGERRRKLAFNAQHYVSMASKRTSRQVLLGTLFDGVVLVGCFPFLAPFLHLHFGLSYAGVGLILACFGVGSLAFTRVARQMVARLGESGMVLTGAALMAAGLVIGVATPDWRLFPLVEFMLGFGFLTLHTVLQSRSTELLPDARGTAVSGFAFMLFLGQSIGALGMGLAIAEMGYRNAFMIQSGLIVVLGLWLHGVMRRMAILGFPEPGRA